MEELDIAQKVKVKCGVEGDVNMKFFDGMFNKNRKVMEIHGVIVDGDWIMIILRLKILSFHYLNIIL